MTTHKILPSIADISDALRYDPDSGDVYTNKTISYTTAGYQSIYLCKNQYLLHRLVYKLHYGIDPMDQTIDHIDGDISNMRANNLRLATRAQNMCNRKGYTSIAKGVYKTKSNKLEVRITKNSKTIYLGTFGNDELDLARITYMRAAIRLHGEFARLN